MNLPKLIGISGHAGAGKDTASEYLQRILPNCDAEPLARPLKHACSILFGIPLENFYVPALKEEIIPHWGTTPRKILQHIATEVFRDSIWKLLTADHEDFWVRRLEGKLSGVQHHTGTKEYTENDVVIISDIRFQNELDFVLKNKGIHIHLTRSGASGNIGIPGHKSEKLLVLPNHSDVYEISNNGSLEDLYVQLNIITENYFITI